MLYLKTERKRLSGNITMNDFFFDAKSDINVKLGDSIIYQENMPSYLELELPYVMSTTLLCAIVPLLLVLVLLMAHPHPFGVFFIFLIMLVVFLFLWLSMMCGAYIRSHLYGHLMIKYTVFDDRIIVSNIATGICIFDFPISEISYTKSVFHKLQYLSGNTGRQSVMDRIFTCCTNKPCLLISSPHDEYKQRIPIGYSKEMILELDNFLLGKTIPPFVMRGLEQ